MKKFKMVYMDGFDEVRDLETQDVVFSTEIPESIKPYFERVIIEPEVIDNVVLIWNETNDLMTVDEYLLDEEKCTQEEREEIIEFIHSYMQKL